MKQHLVYSLFWLLLCLALPLVGEQSSAVSLQLEYALTPEMREHGLMGRYSLPPNQGMLFCYPTAQPITIWMYNTLLDLSVAFLDQNKVIKEIHELKAYPQIKEKDFFHKRAVSSSFDASYALEMDKKWFEIHAIQPGDFLIFDFSSPYASIIKTKRKS